MYPADTFIGLYLNIRYHFPHITKSLSFNLKKNMRKQIYPILLTLSITLTSCTTIMANIPGVYTLDIQQGNVINQDMIDQLKPSMTKRQVLYIMGSSMLVDVFHQTRWDYIYSEQLDGEQRKQKRLSLFFNGDILSSVQGDFKPNTSLVNRKSNETTIEVPTRILDKTLWGKIVSFFSSNESAKKKVSNSKEKKHAQDSKKFFRDDFTNPDNI